MSIIVYVVCELFVHLMTRISTGVFTDKIFTNKVLREHKPVWEKIVSIY